MRRSLSALILTCTLAAAAAAAADVLPAAEPGLSDACRKAGAVERWNEGEGFTVFPTSGRRHFAMRLLGSQIDMDGKSPRLAMMIDNVYYQFVFVPIVDFAPVRPTDAEVLARHAAWEFEHVRQAGGPLDRFEDLGNKSRPADGTVGAATFKLWRMHDAANTTSQFFVTTVVGDEVVVMSAILRPSESERFRAVMRNYAESLLWWDCPPR